MRDRAVRGAGEDGVRCLRDGILPASEYAALMRPEMRVRPVAAPRRGARSTPRLLIQALVLLMAGGFTGALAHEPDGRLRFSVVDTTALQGTAAGLQPGESLVRVIVEGIVPLQGAVLKHWADSAVAQRLIQVGQDGDARPMARGEGAPRAAVDLGDLIPGKPLVLDFAESFAEGTGGVVVVSIEIPATDSNPAFSESFGIAVGQPGTPGVTRNGALEFPAHQLPETSP